MLATSSKRANDAFNQLVQKLRSRMRRPAEHRHPQTDQLLRHTRPYVPSVPFNPPLHPIWK